MSRPTLICLTPVRNEAMNLDRFLRSASLWADRIIVLDHCSEDGTRDIARTHPKVELLEYASPQWDELARRTLLVEAARRCAGPRLLIGMDADEILTANVLNSPEWRRMLTAPPGTVVLFDWVHLLPGFESCRVSRKAVAFMDDGSAFVGKEIHGQRVPIPKNDLRLVLNEVKLLHYAYVDSDLIASKFRFYMCVEELLATGPRPVAAYRRYHHLQNIPARERPPVEPRWFEAYEKLGIDLRQQGQDRLRQHQYHREVLVRMVQHSAARFKAVPIWDLDWASVAQTLGMDLRGVDIRDPRGGLDKTLHAYLKWTQPFAHGSLCRLVGKVDSWIDRLRVRLARVS